MTPPKLRYKIPEPRLISNIFLSLSLWPIAPAPITLAISARIFIAMQVLNMIIRLFIEYTEPSDAAINTQKEITPGFKVLIIKPEVNMAR